MPTPQDRPVLVTGAAGFIGFHVSLRLLREGWAVHGFDSVNAYYDPRLKEARLAVLNRQDRFRFARADLADADAVEAAFAACEPSLAVHLAAQAGVRYGLENPRAYVDSNLVGFFNVVESARRHRVRHLLYASSSSVYGANTRRPFSEHHPADHPVSFYAATKRANELMAHAYAHLHGLPMTGLRFFTVYGPWGRPDMAVFMFTKAILEGRPIEVVEGEEVARDFTYVDDAAEAVVRLLGRPPSGDPDWSGESPDPAGSKAPHRIYNVGQSEPVKLRELIRLIEAETGATARIVAKPMPAGEVPATSADATDLEAATGFRPRTSLADGIHRFVRWYREFHGV